MTQKERLIKVLRKEQTDRRPFICPGGMMTMIVTDVMGTSESSWPEAHSSAEGMAALTLAAHTLSGVENLGVPFCMTVEAEGMGERLGDLGTRESEPKVLTYAINTMDEIDRLAALDVNKGRAKVCVDAIRILKERVPRPTGHRQHDRPHKPGHIPCRPPPILQGVDKTKSQPIGYGDRRRERRRIW